MTDSFLSVIEREAKNESDRVVAELKKLRLEATQVITVLNALNLEVPQELRTLSPIEYIKYENRSAGIEVLIPDAKVVEEQFQKDSPLLEVLPEDKPKRDGGVTTSGHKEARRKQKTKAEQRYIQARTDVITALSKGPVMRSQLDVTARNYRRMKQEGVINHRTVGFQGPSEVFLPERPVSLETLRDEVVKMKGDISLDDLLPLGFTGFLDLSMMMEELVAQGIVEKSGMTYFNPVHKAFRDTRTKDEKKVRGRVNGAVAGTGRTNKLSSDKEVRQILAKAEKMGAQVKKQGSGHILVSFRGEERILASTPGDSNRSNREKLQQLGINV